MKFLIRFIITIVWLFRIPIVYTFQILVNILYILYHFELKLFLKIDGEMIFENTDNFGRVISYYDSLWSYLLNKPTFIK